MSYRYPYNSQRFYVRNGRPDGYSRNPRVLNIPITKDTSVVSSVTYNIPPGYYSEDGEIPEKVKKRVENQLVEQPTTPIYESIYNFMVNDGIKLLKFTNNTFTTAMRFVDAVGDIISEINMMFASTSNDDRPDVFSPYNVNYSLQDRKTETFKFVKKVANAIFNVVYFISVRKKNANEMEAIDETNDEYEIYIQFYFCYYHFTDLLILNRILLDSPVWAYTGSAILSILGDDVSSIDECEQFYPTKVVFSSFYQDSLGKQVRIILPAFDKLTPLQDYILYCEHTLPVDSIPFMPMYEGIPLYYPFYLSGTDEPPPTPALPD